ncbi:MAG TPA: MiaB/RimO family radical SAM methylthiotransferase, partial [Gemmatimonadales bacterium]|nr:MiaB/RimO family radical SAM methylthiotransferase [Gemmatimonadales bacterium]
AGVRRHYAGTVMRVYLHTFGCKANQYDTEAVAQAIVARGAEVVEDPRAADAAVVNSCTVTHVAEAKLRSAVRRLARGRMPSGTVVMGCAAARDDGRLARLPGVVSVIPGADVQAVVSALGLPRSATGQEGRAAGRGARAWLKIQDGCDEHCTFCATKLARGANRSRSVTDLVDEAVRLAEHHEEIVLTGVHIGTYGADLGEGACLGRLVESLVQRVPRVRFRLSSVEATEVDQRIEDLMVGCPDRLAPHLHAPLQSGSDRVLRRMGRHWYTAASYRARIERLAARLPHLGLGADVIVGFPGETDADHARTAALVRGLPFTYLHVFPYSPRPGAAALRLGDAVDSAVRARRSEDLRGWAEEQGRAYQARRVGGAADVVVLQRRGGTYEGLTEDYLTAFIPVEGAPVPGRIHARLSAERGRLIAQAA